MLGHSLSKRTFSSSFKGGEEHMKSVLKPALDNLDRALDTLESAVDKNNTHKKKTRVEPELDLSARNEREVNRKIAAKLDQTINRLEMILSEE